MRKMMLHILFCWILGTYFVTGDVRWNKFVNPYQNRTKNTRYARQLKSAPWFRHGDYYHWHPPFHSGKVHPSSRIHQAIPPYMQTSDVQMDKSYSPETLLWSPSEDETNARRRASAPWGFPPTSVGMLTPNFRRDSSREHPTSLQIPSHKMVWNEDGQFWGYDTQADSSDLTKEQLMWSYGSDQALPDDGSCVPPFCIPIDCGNERSCQNRPTINQMAVACVGSECPVKCSSLHSCPPGDSACPHGLHGPMCAVMNASICQQRYSLDCLFGCSQFANPTEPPKCVCGPNSSLSSNQTGCLVVSLESFQCPFGCSGRGTCNPRTKICHCEPGYTGLGCETKVSSCPAGMTGADCKLDIDECLSDASGCEQRCVNTYGSFRCECNNGYAVDPKDPKRCVIQIPNCDEHCVVGQGVCNSENRCVCTPGFEGQWCAQDVDECQQGTHSCDQICVNTHGSYECRCYQGYEVNPRNPKWCLPVSCQPPCVPTQGTCSTDRRCVCKPGFTGSDCGQDVDECTTGEHQCAHICFNTHGSYYCTCRPGYTPDPSKPNECLPESCDPRCVDEIGPCVGRTCLNGVCHVRYQNDTARTYCECHSGYEGQRCEHDIDECSSGSHHCMQLCHNTPGSYACACRPGYILGLDKRTCIPKETACGTGCLNGGICQSNGQCKCPTNFTGNMCEYDINQCQKILGCEQLCFPDKEGNFQCACRPGYQLTADRRSCVANGPCEPPCQNGAQCFRGRCLCKSGFEGSQCELDKDECQLPAAVHGCMFECVNTVGSYECRCPSGYQRLADNRTCVRSPSGTHCNPPCKNGAVCRPGNQCECLRGYAGVDCGKDIDECEELRPCDPKFGTCVNTPGGFECICQPGYRLMVDGRHCIDEQRARHAPHLVFRGRGQKGIVVASKMFKSANHTQPLFEPSSRGPLRRKRFVQHYHTSYAPRRTSVVIRTGLDQRSTIRRLRLRHRSSSIPDSLMKRKHSRRSTIDSIN